MKHVGTIIGTCIAGMFVMSVWGAFVGAGGNAGIIAGWFAGFIIIGTMWMLNHYIGIINNDGAFVDMATGIGVAGVMRGFFETGWAQDFAAAGTALVESLPTILVVCIGGAIGGVAAVMLEKQMQKAAAEKKAA